MQIHFTSSAEEYISDINTYVFYINDEIKYTNRLFLFHLSGACFKLCRFLCILQVISHVMYTSHVCKCKCGLCTWVEAEVDVISSHAGGRVGDGKHVGVELHSTQWVLRNAAVHGPVMVKVTLWMEAHKCIRMTLF